MARRGRSAYLNDDQRRRLLERWSEPHRRYHTADHLEQVLVALDVLRTAGAPFDDEAVELAVWFHDAIYRIPASDNETASADLARRMLAGRPCADEVARLVEVTATHAVAVGDTNAAALCDADLAILGGTPEQYTTYARRVREEYASIPDEVFRPGRAEVMSRLLDRDSLFHTDAGRGRWEAAARANVSAEIETLRLG